MCWKCHLASGVTLDGSVATSGYYQLMHLNLNRLRVFCVQAQLWKIIRTGNCIAAHCDFQSENYIVHIRRIHSDSHHSAEKFLAFRVADQLLCSYNVFIALVV